MKVRTAVLGILLAAIGCHGRGGGGGGGDDDDNGGGSELAREACNELADWFAAKASDCLGESFSDSRASFVDSCCDGSCENIISLRDADEFEGQCVPWLESQTCDEFTETGEIDSSCQQQLERRE